MNIIDTKNLTKTYGNSRGISDVNLQIREGEIFGFVGPNGAGKSTTIRTLLNFIFQTRGSATILGMDIVKDSAKIKEFVSYVPSEVRFYDDVRVSDIINYSASFYKNCNIGEIDNLCKTLDVEVNKKMGELSLGNKKKVAIVQALISNPKLLILDEPTNGLDPLIQKKLFELILQQNKKGMTIFFSSHNLVEVENICDRVAVIKEGKIIDTIEINKISKKSGVNVEIESEGLTKEIIKDFGGENIRIENETFKFRYSNDVDKLIIEIAKVKVKKLLISEVTLEEKFMNYYKKEGEK
ncbi:MAG: ABC transporter ATP-binding protein [Clostridium sp.]